MLWFKAMGINPLTAWNSSLTRLARRWPPYIGPAATVRAQIELAIGIALGLMLTPAVAADLLPTGLSAQGVYDGDWWDNAAGGIRRGAVYAAHLDTSLSIDAERLFGLPTTRFYFRSFSDNGASIGRRVGSAQGVNNWESGYPAAKLLEAWVDHRFFDKRLSLRFGLYDTTTEFDKNKSQAIFANSAQGMNAPLALSGDNGPSTYPATSLALRARYTFDDSWTAKLAIVDGVPGARNDPAASDIHVTSADGALIISELRYHRSDGRRFDMGYWRYTNAFPELNRVDGTGAPQMTHGNQGFYLSGDTMLTSSADDLLRGISVGARIAYAEVGFNQFNWSASASITDLGLWSRRPDDKIGVGLLFASTGADYLHAQQTSGMVARPNEWVMEVTWRAPLTDWLSLQPDVQYILNPAHASAHRSALVFGLRMEITANFGGS